MSTPESSVGEAAILVHEILPVKTVRDIARAELGQMETSEHEKFILENAKNNLIVLDRIVNLQSVAVYLSKQGQKAKVFSGSRRTNFCHYEVWIQPFQVVVNSNSTKEGSFSAGKITIDRLERDWNGGNQEYIRHLGSFAPAKLIAQVRSGFH